MPSARGDAPNRAPGSQDNLQALSVRFTRITPDDNVSAPRLAGRLHISCIIG